MLSRCLRLIAVALIAFAANTPAHHASDAGPAKLGPSPDSPYVELQGYVEDLIIDNLATGTSQRFPVFVSDDGRRFLLRGKDADAFASGAGIAVSGKADGRSLFAESARVIAANDRRASLAAAASTTSIHGLLRLGHADNFDGAPSEFFFSLFPDAGAPLEVTLVAQLGVLANEMKVTATGRLGSDGALIAERIVVEALPQPKAAVIAKATVTNQVLVIPIKFKDANGVFQPDPSSIASIQSAIFGTAPTQSVAEYYKEVSFGQQLLAGTVANSANTWLKAANAAPVPASCDYGTIGSQADAAATAAGYNINNYVNRVYVFEQTGFSCGWAGLAYVGWGRAWIKGPYATNLLVVGHELGHNFGLLHAASLDCGANVIGGTCSVAEYGDPFNVMGNNRAMHFSASQKRLLNWIPASSTPTHAAGTTTYTLTPLETPGGAQYAVKVPTTNPNRTYWLEYRQPIGFDSGLSAFPNNGAQVRVGSPFETTNGSDDVQFIDMTPATGAFTDGALLAGQTYVDGTYGVTINVLTSTPTALTVQVSLGPVLPPTTTSVASSLNPSAPAQGVTFTAAVTGAAPTGNVAFRDGANVIAGCSAVALAGAGNTRTATCTTATLTQGSHSITASYAGNATNAASTSGALSQVVTASSGTTLTSSLNPSNVGASVTLTATVTGISPTGSVAFTDGGNNITNCGAVALTGAGNSRTAACTTTALAQGTRSIVASYGGNGTNGASSSPALSQVVKAVAATTLVSSLNPSTLGASITLTATVTGVSPTGSVAFKDGGNNITNCGAVALSGAGNSRTAACTTTVLAQGTRSIATTYGGDVGNTAATSSTLSQVVKAATTTGLASSLNPSTVGAGVTFTATVTGVIPTGTVSFRNGANVISGCGTVALSGAGNTRTGACTTNTLTQGSHSITASFAGDAGNATSTSSALAQVVNAVVVGGAPVLQGAALRRVHGAAGAFDLPLSLAINSPTTEPRMGPAHTLILTFDKAITGASVAVTEGSASAGSPAVNGNTLTIALGGVSDLQYVTVTLTNIIPAGGGAAGTASIRIGFLAGDVNQSGVTTSADIAIINSQLTWTVSLANFLADVNLSGTLTVADRGFTNAQLTRALPLPLGNIGSKIGDDAAAFARPPFRQPGRPGVAAD